MGVDDANEDGKPYSRKGKTEGKAKKIKRQQDRQRAKAGSCLTQERSKKMTTEVVKEKTRKEKIVFKDRSLVWLDSGTPTTTRSVSITRRKSSGTNTTSTRPISSRRRKSNGTDNTTTRPISTTRRNYMVVDSNINNVDVNDDNDDGIDLYDQQYLDEDIGCAEAVKAAVAAAATATATTATTIGKKNEIINNIKKHEKELQAKNAKDRR